MAQEPAERVNPIIGTTNYGSTPSGPGLPHAMMSVAPFNVMGSNKNRFDKDKQWWSTPYSHDNCFFTGYSHVNLSGVGCPEMGSLLLMPTSGELNVDYTQYGSGYSDESASPGYYTNRLTKYGIKTAWQAMIKSATTPGNDNFIRPDIDDSLAKGYIPLREEYDNSVSHALEYYIADAALGKFAGALGKEKEAEQFSRQSLNYRRYYSHEYGVFRPILPDGTFPTPFNPKQGEKFEPVPGFHEGSSWNYSFMVPHDVEGLIRLHGGTRRFVKKLQEVFDDSHYDPTNEPNIAYPYLFSYVKGEAWRTQELTQQLLEAHFKNKPDGLPGNDDTGTMSTWVLFTMMGFYPDNATDPSYTLTTPMFDRITLQLDPDYYGGQRLVIETIRPSEGARYIDWITVDGQRLKGFRISHEELAKAKKIVFHLKAKR
jgi:predicted alpha-1,2-mannosidase